MHLQDRHQPAVVAEEHLVRDRVGLVLLYELGEFRDAAPELLELLLDDLSDLSTKTIGSDMAMSLHVSGSVALRGSNGSLRACPPCPQDAALFGLARDELRHRRRRNAGGRKRTEDYFARGRSGEAPRADTRTATIAALTIPDSSSCTKCPESVATTWIASDDRLARRAWARAARSGTMASHSSSMIPAVTTTRGMSPTSPGIDQPMQLLRHECGSHVLVGCISSLSPVPARS